VKVGDQLRGKKVKCPGCNQVFIARIDDENPEEAGPIAFQDDDSRKCPTCHKVLPGDAVLCIDCGTNLKTGKKIASVREQKKLDPEWELQWNYKMPLVAHLIIFGILEPFLLLSTVLAANSPAQGAHRAFVFCLALSGITFFLLGTFVRFSLTSNEEEEPILTRTQWVAFIPLIKKELDLKPIFRVELGYKGDTESVSRNKIILGFFVILITGIFPGVVWLFFFGPLEKYSIDLIGRRKTVIPVFRGSHELTMQRIRDSLHEGVGLELT
jgi:hypothetical protein